MNTVVDWSLYPNFKEDEFRCRHTGLVAMQPAFLEVLQRIRTELRRPMIVTSGYRHPTHPVEARKTHSNGEHTQGACADIACNTGTMRFELVRLAMKHGIVRIGIHKTFLHLGIGGRNLPAPVIWEYT